jgi:hypothetical protein
MKSAARVKPIVARAVSLGFLEIRYTMNHITIA